MTEIGRWLAEAIEKKGVSKRQVALYTEVSHATIVTAIQGKTIPKPKTIRRLAAYFNVPEDYLLELADHRTPPEDLPELDDPELIVYMNGLPKLPRHDQEIVKGVLRAMHEAHQKYGKEND